MAITLLIDLPLPQLALWRACMRQGLSFSANGEPQGVPLARGSLTRRMTEASHPQGQWSGSLDLIIPASPQMLLLR
jgi:hypothetical protein